MPGDKTYVMPKRLPANIVFCVLSMLVSGCVLGPGSLRHSRTNYNRAVQQTAREELLLNLVRLKYHQTLEFIRIPSITGQYSYDVDFGGSGNWQKGVAAKLGLAFGVGATSKPTIVYTPEQAQQFNQRLLAPTSLETIDLLTSKGWAFNRVLRLTVRNINDVDNATSAGGPTPSLKPEFEEFTYLCELFRHLQQNGRRIEIAYEDRPVSSAVQLSAPVPSDKLSMEAVVLAAEKGYRFEPSDDGTSQTLWTRPSSAETLVLRIAPEVGDAHEVQEIRRILELAPSKKAYRIRPDTHGQLQRPHGSRSADGELTNDRDELVISTRSVKEMMFYICHGISVPEAHIEKGLVRQTYDQEGQPFDWSDMTGNMFRVCVQRFRPRNAAVAVQHNGYWFYVDETDLGSMSTFNLLLELFNLEIRAGGGGQIPLLTL